MDPVPSAYNRMCSENVHVGWKEVREYICLVGLGFFIVILFVIGVGFFVCLIGWLGFFAL